MFHRFPIGKYSITQHIPSFVGFYKNLGRLWWGVWLWRISRVLIKWTKYETLSKALIHKCIKNNRHAPRGDFSPAKSLKQHFNIRKIQDPWTNFLCHSCASSSQNSRKKKDKRGIVKRFNLLISLTYLIIYWRGLPGPNDK